jgi:tRNA-specific 2-thiouridylase
MSKGRVIVAMSGGVDSSVSALLLKEQGYEVIGVTMRLWTVERDDLPPMSKRCCSVEDVDDARRVCQVIGAPHYVMNFEREFQQHVVDYFVREYGRGRTPHPCLACNDKIKFDFLLRRANFLEADYIATGHYARIRRNGHGLSLLKAIDPRKDQSYVLFTLTQRELGRLLFPVGEYPKEEVRRMAAQAGLPVADKPDSQEICFIPDGDYRKFIGERAAPRPGEILDTGGNVLGQHPGIQFFTIGQRRGLGLKGNGGQPMFVVKLDTEANQVVLGREEDLYHSHLWASRVNFTSGQAPGGPVEVNAKIRYKASESPATVFAHGDWAEVRFHQPQRALTPGQAVVFYQGEELIGGGVIELESPRLSGKAFGESRGTG